MTNRSGERSWISSRGAQKAADAINARIDKRFGHSSKTDPSATLSRGLLGVELDSSHREIVVVVDPTIVDAASLEKALRKTVKQSHDRDPAVKNLKVRVQGGCASSAQLIEAGHVIHGRSWSPTAKTASFAGSMDPADAAYHLVFANKDREAGEALAKKLGGLVVVTYDKVGPIRD